MLCALVQTLCLSSPPFAFLCPVQFCDHLTCPNMLPPLGCWPNTEEVGVLPNAVGERQNKGSGHKGHKGERSLVQMRHLSKSTSALHVRTKAWGMATRNALIMYAEKRQTSSPNSELRSVRFRSVSPFFFLI